MKPFASLLLFLLMIAGVASPLWANTGAHVEPPAQPEATLPELPEETIHKGPLMGESFVTEETLSPDAPAAGDNDAGPVDYGMGDLPSDYPGEEGMEGAAPLWGEEPALPGAEPAPMDLKNMTGQADHEMPEGDHAAMAKDHVQPAEHEWINTSRKGYWWALALVLLAGLWFGFLDLKKPFEQ